MPFKNRICYTANSSSFEHMKKKILTCHTLQDLMPPFSRTAVFDLNPSWTVRDIFAVCPQEQYIFLHDALLESLKCGETTIPCVSFRTRYAELCQRNPETNKTRMEEEFEVMLFGDVTTW